METPDQISASSKSPETEKKPAPLKLLPLPDASSFPLWFAPALLVLGFAWAVLLRMRESDLAGVSVAIVETGYLALVLGYYQYNRKIRLDWFGGILAISAWATSAWFAFFRSADMGLYLCLVLIGLNVALPAYASGVARNVWDTWRVVPMKILLLRSFFGSIIPSLHISAISFSVVSKSRNVARYAASLAVLGAIFLFVIPLLAGSDAIFARIMDTIVPQWVSELFGETVLEVLAWTTGFFTIVGAWILAPSRLPESREASPSDTSLGSVLSWPIILGGVIALYALYIGVQIRYFFLPADAGVWQTLGLTYAEYLHKGFYELLAVSFINVILAKASFEYSQSDKNTPPVSIRIMIAIIALCAIVIAASGLSRVWHYVMAYGLSTERVLVVYASILTIAIFLIGLGKLALPRLREVPGVVAVSLVSFIALGYSNVEGTVASYNLTHRHAIPLDMNYILSDLSEDALDAKLRLVHLDPEATVYEESNWECIKTREIAWEKGVPESAWPICGRDTTPVSTREVLYRWLLDARSRAG
ncbi:MAG TPA: DUF4173 domain-containing protein [bacterium]|nr:DUF4173 domain-containing protein [bacterium]